jgi:hypothetical protein
MSNKKAPKKASKAAVKRFLVDLRELMQKHDMYIGVAISGDTCCIGTDFEVVDGSRTSHTVGHCSPYLDDSDITEFLR